MTAAQATNPQFGPENIRVGDWVHNGWTHAKVSATHPHHCDVIVTMAQDAWTSCSEIVPWPYSIIERKY